MLEETTPQRRAYPSDCSDAEWEFTAPYLTLMKEDAPQRDYPLRELYNGMRYVIRSGCQWRMIPNDLPPWHTVYEQARRWMKAGCFENMAHDLRMFLRHVESKNPSPSATILDGRTLQSTPESGARAGYDGYKRRKGSKVHIAVDTLGHLLALTVTPANEQERDQVEQLAGEVRRVTGQSVTLAYADQGYTGDAARQAAAAQGIDLVVVKTPEARKGFVLLPKRWVVERSFAWLGRFRRLARDYERSAKTLASLHWIACVVLMLHNALEKSS